jgi:putative oxidoreductase
MAAGGLLALGRLPRLSALALAGSLVPTTLAGHRFWSETDPAKRSMQQIQFFKNVSMLGGLLLAAVDTSGKPSIGWRARHAIAAAKDKVTGD